MTHIKSCLTLIIFLSSFYVNAQTKVDTSNYFDLYSSGENLKGSNLKTVWLSDAEIAQIVYEEMDLAGYEWLNEFQIVKIDSGEYVLAICFSEKSRAGFVFESTHRMFPDKKIRTTISNYKTKTGNDYSEKIVGIDGKSTFIKIKTLPKNLALLKAECYWYQKTNNSEDNRKLVTREDIIYVLRQDVNKAIQLLPSPIK